MADWTETHRPQTLSEVRGNDSARGDLKEWAETWDDHREAVVVHGSPGVGKTSAAHALAADMGWDTIELNASDARTADVIEQVAGEAAKSGTLDAGGGGRRLVVLDEADNVHGNVDRGGTRAITALVKEADQPVVLLANEFYEMSRGLRNACREIEFRDVSKRSILPVLRDVCRQEEVAFEEEALERIADLNSGDLRGAIKDLQAMGEGREELTADAVVSGERDRTVGVFDYLDALIKEADAEGALRGSYDVDETPDDLIAWIEENVPKDYEGRELVGAYRALADADRWLGRVRATQNYSFWRYAADDMTAGVAAARREGKGGWTRYSPPTYWSKLGRTRGTREKRDYVAGQIAARSGTSIATARRDILPHLAAMTHHCTNRELTVAMTAAYDLDAEQVSLVTGSGADTNKVESIVADATVLREAAAVEGSQGAFEGGRAGAGDASEAGGERADGDETTGGDSTESTSDSSSGSADTPADTADTPAGAADAPVDSAADAESADDGDEQSGLGDFV